jgi:hypothetical protein
MAELSTIKLFRMTHVENIPHILSNGITHRNSPHANPNYKSIGDSSLISTRDEFVIPDGRKLGDFIPFYFGPRTPMLYVIQKGFNGVSKTDPNDIVYIVSNISLLVEAGNEILFTDGHAIDSLTDFFDRNSLKDIDEIVNNKDVYSKFWKSTEDTDLKRRKEAEFLVSGDLPPKVISGYVVYGEKTKKHFLENGIHERQVFVSEKYYF